MHFAPAVDRRETELHMSFNAVLDRPGEDLAVGEIVMTVAVDPLAAFAGVTDIRVFRDNADFARTCLGNW